MATLGEFIHELIKKSGMNADDEAIKNFLLNGELVKIEMPEDISNGINKSLISVKDAKNNHPDVKPHYTELALKTIDKSIEKMLEELSEDENIRSEVLSETSTYKRVPMLVNKMIEQERRKSAAGKGDKEAFQKQIDDLHKQIRAEKERADASENRFKEDLKGFKLNTKKTGMLSQYKTVYDDLDPDVKLMTLLNILDKRLQDNGATITFDENENLVLLKKDGTNFYSDSNQQVNPKQYIESMLSETKLLKTAATPATTTTVQQGSANQTGQQPTTVNAATPKVNHALKDLLKSSMGDLENSKQVPIMGS